jgi:Na+-driven multidrug efflux pump
MERIEAFWKSPSMVEYRAESRALISLAAPIIATAFLSFLLQVVDLAFVGARSV